MKCNDGLEPMSSLNNFLYSDRVVAKTYSADVPAKSSLTPCLTKRSVKGKFSVQLVEFFHMAKYILCHL